MSTVRVVNIQHTDATEPNIVLEADGTTVFASGITISGGTNLTVSGTAEFASGTVSAPSITFIDDNNTGLYEPAADTVAITTAATERLRIDSSGRLGVGTNSPSQLLELASTAPNIRLTDTIDGHSEIDGNAANLKFNADKGNTKADSNITFFVDNSEHMRIDSSGRLLVGTTSTSTASRLILQGLSNNAAAGAFIHLQRGNLPASSGSPTGSIIFADNSSNEGARINTASEGAWTSGVSHPGRLVFLTTSTGASSSTERMRIDSSGNVGIGTTSPERTLSIRANNPMLQIEGSGGNGRQWSLASVDDTSGASLGDSGSFAIYDDSSGGGARLSINSSGNVGIGTTSPTHQLTVHNASTTGGTVEANRFSVRDNYGSATSLGNGFISPSSNSLAIVTDSTERMRIDSSGKVGIGTTSPGRQLNVHSAGAVSTYLQVTNGNSGGGASNGLLCGISDAATPDALFWLYENSFMRFGTNNAERMRIRHDGTVTIPNTGGFITLAGHNFYNTGEAWHTRDSGNVLGVNRLTNDGNLVEFRQASVQEGTISVSGGTVSYNGAHLSRWSQLPGGAAREEILRGTVLSNIDEMCEWGDEDNEQLNRMKVSDVEGDKNVSGVFQSWDDDDDIYTDDFYCAMTGDFIIRIAQGVTVERGDLVMSAGDGTAKPQDDDIIRSKTIAKVTSTHVSETYADGSYCVPCVLMAC